MSNFEAGKLYEQIINDVINESRQDFENSGIDEATLQDLRTIWRDNLTAAKVANFSWAPQLSVAGDNSGSNVKTDPENENKTFEFEVKDENGDIAKSLQKSLKKEKALASLDSDDINSDLDDSDDDAENSDEDGDDGEGMIILCLYEKVLRVKNKWKCNLKDGVANINGKDYAFAKATGESEW
jgi:transcription initiation factor TFIIA large subunit